MVKQNEAVFQATLAVMSAAGITYDATVAVETQLSKDLIAKIRALVVADFQTGRIEFKNNPTNQAKLNNPSELSKYVSGLVKNWFNKDKRLNGGLKASSSSVGGGKRAGRGDAQLKELRLLYSQMEAAGRGDALPKITEAINARLAEIEAAKPKAASRFNSALIPDELKDLIPA